MESSGELMKRSSIKKKARADARRAAFISGIKEQHSEAAYDSMLDIHDQALRQYYADAILNSWQPSEITALFCVDDVKKKLTDEGNEFDPAFYVIAWESKFGALDKMAEQQLMPNYKRQRVERVLFTSPSNPSVDLNDTATEKVLDQAALVATGAPVHQIWHPVGDDETSSQMGVEGQHELLLDHLPEDEVKTKTNYLARLKELQSQLATPGCDMTRLMAEVLIVQNLMKTEGRVEGGLGSAASTKLPATLYQAYDKRTAKISITSHLEKINDFLLTQPKHKHLDLLFLSLAGDTLKKFRKYYKKYKVRMTFKRATNWLLLECTHKEERNSLTRQLRSLKQASGESFESFVTRAEEMREMLSGMGVHEDNYHMRTYIEDGMKADILQRVKFEVDYQSWEFDDFVKKSIAFDNALHPTANAPSFLHMADVEERVAQVTEEESLDAAAAASMKNFSKAEQAVHQSLIAKQANKQVEKLMAAQGFSKGKGGKWQKSNNKKRPRSDDKDQGDKVDRTETKDLPGFAKPEQMKNLYPPELWKQRVDHMKSGKPASDAPKLYQRDRWNKRFVCFNCRCTGHTQDRCKKE